MRNRVPKYKRGEQVRVRFSCSSPYRGCAGVIKGIIKEERGILYIVQFGESDDVALANDFLENDLQSVNTLMPKQ